jgi:chemotaxis protein histidine kinase CheA/ActR/RegA family two-component response regulator
MEMKKENMDQILNLDDVIISTRNIKLSTELTSALNHVIFVEDQYVGQDVELINYFLEEVKELTNNIRDLLLLSHSEASHLEIYSALKKIFHTLKGSGRMVGVNASAELSWMAEKLLNDCIEQPDRPRDHVINFAIVIYQIYRLKIIPAIQARQRLDFDLKPYILLGEQLLQNTEPADELLHFLNLEQFFHSNSHAIDKPLKSILNNKVRTIRPCEVNQNIGIFSSRLAQEELCEDKQQQSSSKMNDPLLSSEFTLDELKQAITDDLSFYVIDSTQHYLDEEIKEFFVEEANELLELINFEFQEWKKNQIDSKILRKNMRYLHTLKGGAYMLRADYFGYLTHELESLYQYVLDQQNGSESYQRDCIDAIELIQKNLVHRVLLINNERVDYPIQYSQKVLERLFKTSTQKLESIQKDIPASSFRSELQNPDLVLDNVEITHEKSTIASGSKPPIVEFTANRDSQLFKELIRDCFSLVENIRDDSQLHAKVLNLKYHVHRLRQYIHQSNFQGHQDFVNTLALVDNIEYACEQALIEPACFFSHKELIRSGLESIEKIMLRSDHVFDEAILYQFDQISQSYLSSLNRPNDHLLQDQSIINSHVPSGDQSQPPSMWGQREPNQSKPLQSEQIRISKEHLDRVNELVVEQVSHQTQVENKLQDYANTLTEMDMVIRNLVDQLKRIDSEIASKILANHSSASSNPEYFDLLEMDQYSELNQFSKSLNESASDLLDLKSTLFTGLKSTEVFLGRQSRIQAELQHEISTVYRVPFNQLKTRFERLVSQTSQVLNKHVQLKFNGGDIEIDRSLLDRLIVPLEHMLRNAIDHGIESDEERKTLNKSTPSCINIGLSQYNNELLIHLTDDGRGLDSHHIRQKAIQAGLINSAQQYTEHEIFQLIFHSGLSTAEIISPMSGRGVGLDVVQNEIKALGGHVFVTSTLNHGCNFEIRVPIAKATLDVFIVKVQSQQYALPLGQIERVIRVSPQLLAACEAKNESCLEVDQVSYRLEYLAHLVGSEVKSHYLKDDRDMTIFLFKSSNNENIALVVDDLIGTNIQVVVKPFVAFMTHVDLFSGATILANGEVCLILNDQKLLQNLQQNQKSLAQTNLKTSSQVAQQKLICVVDDSVTVRKVTSKLLERHQYSVMMAKDGVDAIEQLSKQIPDLILLDVEMPRKDGFEVIEWIKSQAALRSIPIIMITSRVGEKHRLHALELGASAYMGKPYQEQALLEMMDKLIHHDFLEEESTNDNQ